MNYRDVISTLACWCRIAHDKDNGFIQTFCPRAVILAEVTWDSEYMRIVYILDGGQYIIESVEIDRWIEFLSKQKEVV